MIKKASLLFSVMAIALMSGNPAYADWRNSGYDGSTRNNTSSITSAQKYTNQGKFDGLMDAKNNSIGKKSAEYRPGLNSDQKNARDKLKADQERREKEFFEQKEINRVNVLLPTLQKLRLKEGGEIEAQKYEEDWVLDWKNRENKMRDQFESEWGSLYEQEKSQNHALESKMRDLDKNQKKNTGVAGNANTYNRAKELTRKDGVTTPEGLTTPLAQTYNNGVGTSYWNSQSRNMKPNLGSVNVVDY